MAVYPPCDICGKFMDFPDVVQVHKECASKKVEAVPSASTNSAMVPCHFTKVAIENFSGGLNFKYCPYCGVSMAQHQ